MCRKVPDEPFFPELKGNVSRMVYLGSLVAWWRTRKCDHPESGRHQHLTDLGRNKLWRCDRCGRWATAW
jgi:hypothetical protein